MKKGLIIFLAVLVLIVGVPFGIITYIETQTENVIIQELKKQFITAKSIRFSYLADVLEIQELKGADPTNPQIRFGVEKIVFTKPNVDAFNPETQGHPTVAEEIMAQNITTSYPVSGAVDTAKIGNMRVLGWRQNVGKFLMTFTNAYSEEYFAAAFDCYVKSIVLSDIQAVENVIVPQKTTTKSIILKDISPHKIGSYETINFSSQSYQERVGMTYTDIASITSKSITIPSPAFFASVWETFFKTKPDFSGNEQKLLSSFEKYMGHDFNYALNINKLDVGFIKENKKESFFSFDKFDISTKYEAQDANALKLSINCNDFQCNIGTVDKTQVLEITKAMLQSPVIQANINLDGSFSPKNMLSKISLNLTSQKLGTFKSSWDFVLPWKNYSELATALGADASLESILQATLTKDALISFEDTGFLPRVLLAISTIKNITLEQSALILQDYFDKNLALIKNHLSDENFVALGTCLKTPGTFTSTLNFPKPNSNIAMGMMLLAAPKAMPLKISCKPTEPLLELAKKLQQSIVK